MAVLLLVPGCGSAWRGSRESSWALWGEGAEEKGLGGESQSWLGSTAQKQLLPVPGCAGCFPQALESTGNNRDLLIPISFQTQGCTNLPAHPTLVEQPELLEMLQ